ncbi:MAG TPA: Qat anti-phage system associated protein QatB [Blastocatellia bacterium]
MRRGLGHYVRTGYGGAGTAARRLGGTASTADALYNALSAMAAGQPAAPGSSLDPALLSGRSAQEVMDAVGEAVRPIDGTQDAEAARVAIRGAVSELLTRFPEADLVNLNDEQRTFAVERYVALDVFHRIELDLGKTIQEKAPNAVSALSRLKQVKDYVKETVSAAFRKLRDAGRTITPGRVGRIVRDALRDTFEVFEGYAE